jgi:hypothetical protein
MTYSLVIPAGRWQGSIRNEDQMDVRLPMSGMTVMGMDARLKMSGMTMGRGDVQYMLAGMITMGWILDNECRELPQWDGCLITLFGIDRVGE